MPPPSDIHVAVVAAWRGKRDPASLHGQTRAGGDGFEYDYAQAPACLHGARIVTPAAGGRP